MKKTTIKKLAAFIFAVTLTTAGLAGCGKADTADSSSTKTESGSQEDNSKSSMPADTGSDASANETKEISGSLSMAGSTSMEKISNAVKDAFMEKYPDVTVTAEFTGSSAGVESLISGKADIGNSSRDLTEDEIGAGAVQNVVAIDGIAVITDKANSAEGLTKDQLIGIYKGEIKNWSEVGGADGPIIVVGREAGSGTRGAFEELLEIEDQCAYANELDSTGAVAAKVSSTAGAIGYVSLDAIDDSVKTLKLDEVEPAVENIKSGSYFLSRPFVMATKGEITEQNDVVKAWFEYMQSEEGKQIIESVGLITVD